jgi:hypothetical protein
MRAVWITPAIPSEPVGVAVHRALGVVENRPWSRQELASGASVTEKNREVSGAEHTTFMGMVDSGCQSWCVGVPASDGAAVCGEGSRTETVPV